MAISIMFVLFQCATNAAHATSDVSNHRIDHRPCEYDALEDLP